MWKAERFYTENYGNLRWEKSKVIGKLERSSRVRNQLSRIIFFPFEDLVVHYPRLVLKLQKPWIALKLFSSSLEIFPNERNWKESKQKMMKTFKKWTNTEKKLADNFVKMRRISLFSWIYWHSRTVSSWSGNLKSLLFVKNYNKIVSYFISEV